jgi:diguanylate cyclase (GGDEF)-like protein
VDNNGSFSVTYRMVMEGGPKYVMMKAARLDDRHIVIGTSNVNAEVQRQKAAMVRSSVAQALSSDYFLIFYIDTKTDRYIEYRPTESDTELDMEQGREDFFNTSRESIFTNVCEESREQVRRLFDKEHLLELLRENGSYTVDYRYLMNGVPTYIHMKASRMADRDDPHIVLGLRNIDERVRREQAQARALQKATELASRDGLTGVKSKRVFVEAEMQWDAGIEENKAAPFAVAVFDLNDLKTINDTMGHAAGDSYLCDGCALICKTFQHSPVYRIGGDEFAAVLTGQDYEHRRELKESFRALNAERRAPEEAVVACGMADYVPGRDTRFQDVFERADADMYENKKFLKNNNKIGGIKP